MNVAMNLGVPKKGRNFSLPRRTLPQSRIMKIINTALKLKTVSKIFLNYKVWWEFLSKLGPNGVHFVHF